MKKLTTKSVLALFGLMMFANMANAQNMNRWIELTVQQGQWIKLDLWADAENTLVKVVSGTKDTTLTVGTTWVGDRFYYAQAGTMKVYGNINQFDCSENGSKITGLNASNNTGLIYLDCNNNNLSSLNLTNLTALKTLVCYNNNLSSLNLTGLTALEYLNCIDNNLSSLNLSGLTALKGLSCFINSINYINLTGCSALEILDVSDNNLSSLDITGCSALKKFYLYSNNFSTQALDDIFCMLPTRLPSDGAFIKVLNNPTEDPNLATVMATNKKNANDKLWSVTDHFNGNEIPATTGNYVCAMVENVWVGGVEVTPANASNITGPGIEGSVSYSPATKTLTLNNATITGYHAVGPTNNQNLYNIYSNDNININVIGTNSLKIDKYSYDDQLWGYGICAYYSGCKDVNLIGSGILNIETNVYSDLYFGNSCIVGESISIGGLITLNINSSDYGIYSNKAISISGGASLEITTNATYSGRAFQVPKGKLTIDNISDRIIMQGNDASSATLAPYLTMQDDGTISWSKPYVKIGRLPVNMNRWIELNVKQGGQIWFNFKADAENTLIMVVSGNNDTTFVAGTDWTGYSHTCYAGGTSMWVYGNIKGFGCASGNLGITGLDVSNNNGLEALGCSNNSISSIKISGCETLSEIFCENNNLSACGLDSIFHQLPMRTEGNEGNIVIRDGDAYDNPGAFSCRDTIATNRNWKVWDFNVGNITAIVNSTYACPYFTIGIEDIMVNNLEAEIYPNPASNLLNVISENANEIITISDLSGKIVHSEKASEKQTSINVSQLSAGMYIVRVGDKVTKFVKE